MRKLLKRFCCEESGMGTVEVIIIIAVLVAVALLFKEGITEFVQNLMRQFFTVPEV